MKKIWFVITCLSAAALTLAGCGGERQVKSGVDVTIEGGGEFPQFLAGKWKDKESKWEIVFEPNGVISSVLMGPIDKLMKPGQITTVDTLKGDKAGIGVYEPGEWMVNYSPASRELTVKVSLKNFYYEWGDELIEGDSIDIFGGPISQDGNVWQAEWTSFPHYIVSTPEHPNFDLTKGMIDENGITTTLTFKKMPPE
jgi:hypothetical protein